MSTPAFLEAVSEAQQAAALLQSALQQANKRADAVGSLLVLPMIVEAVKLADQLRALESALAQSLPAADTAKALHIVTVTETPRTGQRKPRVYSFLAQAAGADDAVAQFKAHRKGSLYAQCHGDTVTAAPADDSVFTI